MSNFLSKVLMLRYTAQRQLLPVYCVSHKVFLHHSTVVKARSNSYAVVRKLENFTKTQKATEAETSQYIEKELDQKGVEVIDPNANSSGTFVDYLESTHTMFNKSSKNLKSLKKELSSNDYDDSEKFYKIFQFLQAEFFEEVEKVKRMGVENFNTLVTKKQIQKSESLNKSLENEPDEKSLMEILTKEIYNDPDSPTTENVSFEVMKMTNSLFSLLEVLLKTEKNADIHKLMTPMDYAQIFEVCKNVPVGKLRMKGLYLSGSLIYRIKNAEGKSLTMDYINESFYIDSLMSQGEYKKAIILFKSKMEKVDQKWWMEMGMMLYLKTNQLRKFNKLFKLTVSRFGDEQINVKALQIAIIGNYKLKNHSSFNYYLSFFKKQVAKYGLVSNEEYFENINNMNVQFESEEQGNAFLNRFEGVRDKHLFAIVVFLIFKNQLDEASVLINMFENDANVFDCNSPRYQINRFHLFLRRILASNLNESYDESIISQMLFELQSSSKYLEEFPESVKVLKQLLNKAIMKLSSNKQYSKDVASFFLSDMDGSLLMNEDLGDGEKYQMIIKFLFNNDTIEPALDILHELETSGKVTSTIYGEFLLYYTSLAQRKKLAITEIIERVEEMMKFLENDEHVPLSSNFLEALIKFYVETTQWNKLILLIDDILDSEMNRGVSAGKEKLITLSLFQTIFDVYAKVQHVTTSLPIFKQVHETQQSLGTLKYDFQTVLQYTMLEKAVFPENVIVQNTIKTLVLSQNWTSLIAILLYWQEKYELKLTEKSFKYILKGLKLSYIAREMQRDSRVSLNWKEMRSKKAKTTALINDQIQNGEIMKFVTMRDETDEKITLYSILEYLKYTNCLSLELLQEKLASFELSRSLLDDEVVKVEKMIVEIEKMKKNYLN